MFTHLVVDEKLFRYRCHRPTCLPAGKGLQRCHADFRVLGEVRPRRVEGVNSGRTYPLDRVALICKSFTALKDQISFGYLQLVCDSASANRSQTSRERTTAMEKTVQRTTGMPKYRSFAGRFANGSNRPSAALQDCLRTGGKREKAAFGRRRRLHRERAFLKRVANASGVATELFPPLKLLLHRPSY